MIDVNDIPNDDLDIQDAIDEERERSTPLPKGRYNWKVVDVVDFITTKNGHPLATLHLEVADGPKQGKRVFYQRYWARQIVALLTAAGVKKIPVKGRALAEALVKLVELNGKGEAFFSGALNWRAFSTEARDAALLEATQADDITEAKALATPADWKAANKVATIASKMEDFPADDDGNYVPSIVCPVSGEEKTAQYEVGFFRS